MAKKATQTYIEGTEPFSIEEIEEAFAKYEDLKEKRAKALEKEVDQKAIVIELLEQYEDDLPTNEDGFSYYKSHDLGKTLTLEVNEKLKVKRVSADDE